MLIGAMAGWAVTAAHAEPAGGGAKRFGAWLASQKARDLLLLVDQSSSLQSTHPPAPRGPAGAGGPLPASYARHVRRPGRREPRGRLRRILGYLCARAQLDQADGLVGRSAGYRAIEYALQNK